MKHKKHKVSKKTPAFGLYSLPSRPKKEGRSMLPVDTSPSVVNAPHKDPQ